MNEPLVSIIVPVYRVEPYLNQCIESLLAQTYHNLEIFLVNDGSPDGCGGICRAAAGTDRRIAWRPGVSESGRQTEWGVPLGGGEAERLSFLERKDQRTLIGKLQRAICG